MPYPYAYTTSVGDGSNTNFSFEFDYLDPDTDLSVSVDGVPASWSLLNDQTVKLGTAPTSGAVVQIVRATDIDSIAVTFADEANLTEDDLNTVVKQSFFAVQELRDDLTQLQDSINDGIVTGGDLPIVTIGQENSFMVVVGGSWTVQSLDSVKTLLGIADAAAGTWEDIPEPPGYPSVLGTTEDGTWYHYSQSGARTLLNLGTMAVVDEDELGDAIHSDVMDTSVPTTAGNIGKLVELVDVGGAPALPAVDGSQLTGISFDSYARFEEQAAYNVDGGTYPVALAWQHRQLTTVADDDIGGLSITGGNASLPAGTYEFRLRTHVNAATKCVARLATSTGTVITMGDAKNGSTDDQTLEVTGRFTAASATDLKVEIAMVDAGAASTTLGTAHGQSAWGPNIYTILEVWKLP